jgi:uncharacterized membrane protein YsdA (DUF1294 family)
MSAILDKLGTILAIWFSVMSVILFLVMRHDKKLSRRHGRRIPEKTLFLLAIFGGALGGVLGMQIFRHKTQHPNFYLGFPLLALVQWGVTIWLLLPPDLIEKV